MKIEDKFFLKNRCTGCFACSNACPTKCISMKSDSFGFMIPQIDHSACVSCRMCEKICPTLTPIELFDASAYVYAAWAKDETIRTQSTSGGIFPILAEEIFMQGGIVTGVAFDAEGILRHYIVDKIEDIVPFKGVKYVQSNPGDIYLKIKAYLAQGRKVLFTSTPCQVAALKAVVKEHENLITCDLLCFGAPSNKLFREYLEYVKYALGETDTPDYNSFMFRNTEVSTENTFSRIKFKNGKEYKLCNEQNNFLEIFYSGVALRNSCYACHYQSTTRVGDLTIGDFWGLGQRKKFKYSTVKGCSIVILNSTIGRLLFEKVKDKLFYERRCLKEGERGNALHPLKRQVFSSDDFYERISGKNILLENSWKHKRPFFIRVFLFAKRKFCKLFWCFFRKINFFDYY